MFRQTTTQAALLATAALIAAGTLAAHAESVEERFDRIDEELEKIRTATEDGAESHALSLHGYGELHYNNLDGRGGASDKRELDFHRFVLYLGYDYSERIRFVSELELEHALSGDGKPGEVELEQAFIDIDLCDASALRAGLFLLPVGLLNQVHEPPRFNGVERNGVEKNIIPTTWWEGGVGLHGENDSGWNYALYVHSGLETSTGGTYSVRSGRQKVAKASAQSVAATAAIGWQGRGLALGGALQYQDDITQGTDDTAGSAWLGEVHLDASRGPVRLRALYAEWALDGDGPESVDADRQSGWYVEPAYRVCDDVTVFARYSEWDNQAGSGATASGKEQLTVGVNWYPHEQVVFKADAQWQNNANGKDQDGFNLGVGYDF
ncbi:MAG: porin [Kiritimatiellia bacterium]|jgi:hypothetical protein|nr:porin [Kiritimatiellia bacterium]MDP6631158.1 porin [Kiritimatiellia bacterium]MDP6809820.1 porin [Kiritimatiellia bacterium]MDP7025070.1 porin [Kiritimatiellia bacterium]